MISRSPNASAPYCLGPDLLTPFFPSDTRNAFDDLLPVKDMLTPLPNSSGRMSYITVARKNLKFHYAKNSTARFMLLDSAIRKFLIE